MDENKEYEYLTVKAIKGTEKKTIAKKEAEGWEYVGEESKNLVQTTLKFRMVKKPLNKKAMLIGGGAVALVAVVGIIAAALGGGSSKPDETAAPSTSESAPSSEGSAETTDQTEDQDPSGESETSIEPTEEPEPTTDPVLTVKNNKDLAKLMKVGNYCDASVQEFGDKYAGQTIKFDGHISDIAKHGNYSTRFDLLLGPGFDVESGRGPGFQYRDVNLISDMNWQGENPDGLAVGDTFTFEAKVLGYEGDNTCLFLLDPVSTTPAK